MVGHVSNEAVTAVGSFKPALLDPHATHGVFIAITRTEVPVARNKYPEETVEEILDVAERILVERGYEHTTMI